MYTPRQPSSSLTPSQSSLDPSTGIRVVIQPAQSSYFAGEPFTCTVTFTNTRTAVPSPQVRSLSASFNPGHRRAAHSVSSAPLARPPTSPGTPKTAQPYLAHQNREADAEDRVKRKGMLGKPTTTAAVLEKKRRNMTRSLSVDVTAQDLIKRLADKNSSRSASAVRAQSEQTSPNSPHFSSPLAREQVNSLPPSHPHARKDSLVSEDVTSHPMSHSSPYPPQTPNTASASSFQISLDPITENGTNYHTPTTSEHPGSSKVTQPPPPSQGPRGHRPSALGLGMAPPNTRVNGMAGHPPHTAYSTSFSLPSTELLLYAYAQLTGTLSVDPAFMPTSSEFLDLRNALHKKAAVGGGSLDIGSGSHRRRASGGFFGFLSSNTISNANSRASVPGGITTPAGTLGDDNNEALPTLETQPSMLAVDLTLAAGESRSYLYTLDLPANLPPTFKGRALRFSYQLIVGTCRASTPFVSASSSGLASHLQVGSPAQSGDSERRRSRVMRVPIRVYNHVAVGAAPHPYDLLWPVARRHEKATIGRIDEVKGNKSVVNPAKPIGSLTSVRSYAQRLLSGDVELDLEPLTDETGEGGALSGCREAVEITTRNPKKVSYDVSKDEDRVAVLTFVKSAYRLGETVLGVVELNEGHCRSKVLGLSAMLEAHENLPWPGGPVRRVHAEHHSTLVADMRRVTFALDIPSDASPAFEVGQGPNGRTGGLEWKVRLCLLVSAATGTGSAKGKGRAVEVRGLVRDGPAGEWGTSWRASESLTPMERVRAPPPEQPLQKTPRSWLAIFNTFANGTYHDADEQEDEDNEDDGEWAEMSAETVECLVPIRIFAGNTAFRAMEIMFDV
ncbi:Rgp1-domain-containing protein [Gautieria morchelliformis]|nr:Rgp1-domain-containing protein [Gautieria morchelliformis]